ncbi:uncharacterized protein LOC142338425 isoform X2 [Convolutriloba macropyga]|uniref:uncharacterized protein LOC142338425 isoform X2 n=1 Tax=Convolutriloba macropyga TaxID=536237 RepID=UPI003F5248FF
MTNQNESSAGGTVIEQQKDGILANGIKPSDPHELGDTNLSVLPREEKLSNDSIKRRDVDVTEDAQAKQIISNNVDFDSALDVPTNTLNKGMQQIVQSNLNANNSVESEKGDGLQDDLQKQNATTQPTMGTTKEAEKKVIELSPHNTKRSQSQDASEDNHSPLIVEIEGSGSDEGANNNNNSQGKAAVGHSEVPEQSEGAAGAGTTTSLSSSSPELPADKPVLCLRLIISSGSTAEFTVNPEWTVREITAQVHANWPTHWAEEQREGGGVPQVSDPSILRLIYQGRFLHSSMTLKALNLQEGHTVVMHLVPRESLPESNLNDGKKSKREREGHCCIIM